MIPGELVGRTIRSVTGAWFIHGDTRAASPDPIWLEVEGLGHVRCGCGGSGTVSLGVSSPVGFDMAEAGRVEIRRWTDAVVTPLLGNPIEKVLSVVYEPHEAEVGFVLVTGEGAVAIANLGDELEVGAWPDSRWSNEAVVVRG